MNDTLNPLGFQSINFRNKTVIRNIAVILQSDIEIASFEVIEKSLVGDVKEIVGAATWRKVDDLRRSGMFSFGFVAVDGERAFRIIVQRNDDGFAFETEMFEVLSGKPLDGIVSGFRIMALSGECLANARVGENSIRVKRIAFPAQAELNMPMASVGQLNQPAAGLLQAQVAVGHVTAPVVAFTAWPPAR